MQITSNEISNTKYVQIYLTNEELEKQETKEVIEKYKKEEKFFKFLANLIFFLTNRSTIGFVPFLFDF